MLQQINFYPLLPKPARYPFTPALGLRLLFGFILLLSAVYLFNLIIYVWQYTKLNELQQTQKTLQQQLIQLTSRYSGDPQHWPLKWQNAQLILELHNKQARLAELKQTKFINEQSYAGYLFSFAAAIAPDVWLKQIHIVTANQQVDLAGNTTSSNALMQFVQRLGQQSIFQDNPFNVIKVENPPDNHNILSFTLSTNAQRSTK